MYSTVSTPSKALETKTPFSNPEAEAYHNSTPLFPDIAADENLRLQIGGSKCIRRSTLF